VTVTEPRPPQLRPHHSYRSWTSSWRDEQGHRRTRRFGRERETSAAQAKARFRHWFETQFRRFDHVRNLESQGAIVTVEHVANAYREHARSIYRKHGETTSHVWSVTYAMDALIKFYGHVLAAEFRAHQLAQLREAMIWTTGADGAAKRRSMKTVNNRLYCIKEAFRWASVEKGVVPESVALALRMVKPLAKGRSEARDPVDVAPIDESIVWDTLEHCPPTLRAMIELQWWTGMRPGELVIMRPCDIETSGDTWFYRPARHKLEHKDKERIIPLGKRAQRAIAPYLKRDLQAYMFSPAEAMRQRRALVHQQRKTPIEYGNRPGTNVRATPVVQPGERYTTDSYRKSIIHACRAGEIVAWNPNQIRHSWGTRVRKLYGIESASVGLGHSSLSTTEIYAEKSLELAVKVARRVG
jgi:integrase